jgi:hypothetical protein
MHVHKHMHMHVHKHTPHYAQVKDRAEYIGSAAALAGKHSQKCTPSDCVWYIHLGADCTWYTY